MIKKKLKFLIVLFLVAFLLNFAWEHAHGILYGGHQGGPGHTGIPWGRYMWVFFRATFWDAVIITGLYGFIALMKKQFFWLHHASKEDNIIIVLIGLGIATFIELRALNANRWSYNEMMPIVPGFEVGLTPFLQLATLALLSFFIMKKINHLLNTSSGSNQSSNMSSFET